MNFPMPNEFLEAFGIAPCYVDEEYCYFQYTYTSKSGSSKAALSFSGISASFQINLFSCDEEIMVVSSEKVRSILIFEEDSEAGVRVAFDYQGISSEAKVVLEPDLKVSWWVLRSKE